MSEINTIFFCFFAPLFPICRAPFPPICQKLILSFPFVWKASVAQHEKVQKDLQAQSDELAHSALLLESEAAEAPSPHKRAKRAEEAKVLSWEQLRALFSLE